KSSNAADVTEGSNGIWERLHYDWSNPNRVVLTTTDSNLWGGGSGHTYTFTRQPDGKNDIDVVIIRDGKNLRGRLLGAFVGAFGKGVLKKAFQNSVKAIEARNSGTARAAGAARPFSPLIVLGSFSSRASTRSKAYSTTIPFL